MSTLLFIPPPTPPAAGVLNQWCHTDADGTILAQSGGITILKGGAGVYQYTTAAPVIFALLTVDFGNGSFGVLGWGSIQLQAARPGFDVVLRNDVPVGANLAHFVGF